MVGVTSKKEVQVHKWSEKKMGGGDEGLNTVQCLRGRLLAERHASKVANQEVESICNKLIEVEKKLREEMRLREKAEKRLQYLKNKLQSFNISSGESHQCQTCTTNPSLVSHTSMHKHCHHHPCCHFHKSVCQNPNTNSQDLNSHESRLSISSSKSSTKDSIALSTSTDDYSSNTTNSGDSISNSLEEDHTHNQNPCSTEEGGKQVLNLI